MYRTNSARDVIATGTVQIDSGDGVTFPIPLTPSEGGGGGQETPDTGTIDITSSFPEITNGGITVRRWGPWVVATIADVEFANSDPPQFFYPDGEMPTGYRPAGHTSFVALADLDGTITRRFRLQAGGQVLFYDITPTMRLNVVATYLTPDPWPNT